MCDVRSDVRVVIAIDLVTRHNGGMSLDGVLGKLDLKAAAEQELKTRNRLMPPRWDRLALVPQAGAVTQWLRPRYTKGLFGERADVVFVEKNRSGVRPISELTLTDRVLYRALVGFIAEALPEGLTRRPPNSEFQSAPLQDENVRYVSKSDVAAYYEFIDHELLEIELLSQTGEAPAIAALLELLGRVMGRRVGLPQIHKSSDILGDTYIDPVRRRMRRAGFDVYTYSDDFRIASTTLAAARAALESCASEVRGLGLVLNESKTYTYGVAKYRESLNAFAEAERRLFDDQADQLAFLLDEGYADADDESEEEPLDLGGGHEGAEDDAIVEDGQLEESAYQESNERQVAAAKRAWEIWMGEEAEEATSPQDAAITMSLLSRALPILGAAGVDDPLHDLSRLLRREPAVTPQVASYLINLGKNDQRARTLARQTLDQLVGEDSFSVWQRMWLAEAAGHIRRSGDRPLYRWLVECVASAPAPLAATAAAAIGRLGLPESNALAAALDRVGPVWRGLVLWALANVDPNQAAACADSRLDRLLIEAVKE